MRWVSAIGLTVLGIQASRVMRAWYCVGRLLEECEQGIDHSSQRLPRSRPVGKQTDDCTGRADDGGYDSQYALELAFIRFVLRLVLFWMIRSALR